MSIIQPNSIKAIAHSVDIPRLSEESAKTLAPDVEYRLREVVQEALKFAKHAKRTKLTTEDINNALKLRNVDPVYGFSSKDPAKFLRVAAHPELMYMQDPEASFNQLIESALPKLPRDAGVTAHWLCINGVQPDLPENISVAAPPSKRRQLLGPAAPGTRAGALQEAAAAAAAAGLDATMQAGLPSAASDAATAGAAGASARLGALSASAASQQQQQLMLGGGSGVVGVSPRSVANAAVQLQLPLRHAVSRELQVYFDRVVGLILTTPAPSAGAASAPGAAAGGQAGLGGGSVGQQGAGAAAGASADKQATLLTGALSSVASDPGLHPLVPYFCSFIADGVKQHLSNLVVLERLLLLTRALLANPGVHLAPYLQQLLPAVMTCVVTKTIGALPTEEHWSVRREAAALLSTIAAQFAAPHHNLQPRLCRVLAQALLDADKPFTSKYGAVVGLQALGPQVVRTLLIPHLEPFMSAVLFPAMAATTQPGTPADAADADARQHHSSSALRQQQQQQAAEAWRVYDALLSAVGGAVYDLLIGSMRGRLPVHLIFPRPASTGDTDWQAEYTRTLLAARRQAGPHRQQQQGQQGRQMPGPPDLGGAGTSGMQEQEPQQGADKPSGQGDGAAGQAQQGQQGAADGKRVLRGPPALIKGQGPRSASSAAAAAAGSNQPSVAEVLGQSWKEDSDVNATLGALLSLFGEDLLPSLPLPELAAVSL